MATKQEKIAALTELMISGILSSDEFTRIVSVLDGSKALEPDREESPAEKTYRVFIQEKVAPVFKSPSSVKYPPFSPDMVKEGYLDIDGSQQKRRYIETYIDAPNSYGTMLREQIVIVIDDDFVPQFWGQHLIRPFIGGKTKSWHRMS